MSVSETGSGPETGSDEELAALAAGGSRAAFEELVEHYGGSVLAVLEKRLGDHHEALDLAQEAWVSVFRSLAGFRPALGSFRAWLFSIVLNAARDEGRRRGRARIVYLDEFRGEEEGADDPTDASADKAATLAALTAVAEPFRTAVFLVDGMGFSYEDAAQSLACAIGTVKSRVNRGRLAFRDHWTRLSGESVSEATAGGTS